MRAWVGVFLSGYIIFLAVVLHDSGGNQSGPMTPDTATPSAVRSSTIRAPRTETPTATSSPTRTVTNTRRPTRTITPTPTETGTPTQTSTPTPTPLTILAVGDIAKCDREPTEGVINRYTPAPDNPAYLTGSLVGTAAAALNAPVFTLGDNSNDYGTEWDYQNCFEPMWGAIQSTATFYPAMGNHDLWDTPVEGTPYPYIQYFPNAAGPSGRGYYSLDLGESWHVVVLNSNCSFAGGCGYSASGAPSPQLRWLQNDLAANTRTCILAIWHTPLFTTGQWAGDEDVRNFWNILYPAGADLILNGHNHNYERFYPQNPLGTPDPTQGIQEFVVGLGGASKELYNLTPTPETEAEKYAGNYAYLKLTLWADHYLAELVSVSGRIRDHDTGVCHP